VLQAKLFSKMRDVDGKLGPATKAAILRQSNTSTPSSLSAANATQIRKIAEGKAPLSSVNVTTLVGALSLVDAPKKAPKRRPPGVKLPSTPVALRDMGQPKTAGLGGNVPLILGVALLGTGVYNLMTGKWPWDALMKGRK